VSPGRNWRIQPYAETKPVRRARYCFVLVGKAGGIVQKRKIELADRPVALLGNDDLGQTLELEIVRLIDLFAKINMTTSASCSIEPDSRRSESCGRWSPPRLSGARLSCDKASTGTPSSLAIAFSPAKSTKLPASDSRSACSRPTSAANSPPPADRVVLAIASAAAPWPAFRSARSRANRR